MVITEKSRLEISIGDEVEVIRHRKPMRGKVYCVGWMIDDCTTDLYFIKTISGKIIEATIDEIKGV